jgi:hypothetical protein
MPSPLRKKWNRQWSNTGWLLWPAISPEEWPKFRLRKWVIAIVAGSLMMSLAACSSMDVKTGKDPQADFSRFRTFAWTEQPIEARQVRPSSILDQTVKASVERELPRRGLTPAAGAPPDLLIGYVAGAQTAMSYFSRYGHSGDVFQEPYTYRLGSLTLEFIDPKTNRVVWQGTAADVIGDAGATQDQVAEAVRKILSEYPTA